MHVQVLVGARSSRVMVQVDSWKLSLSRKGVLGSKSEYEIGLLFTFSF